MSIIQSTIVNVKTFLKNNNTDIILLTNSLNIIHNENSRTTFLFYIKFIIYIGSRVIRGRRNKSIMFFYTIQK